MNEEQIVETTATTGTQVQNQNQVQTQNQGEDSQIQTNTQEQENLHSGEDQQEEGITHSQNALQNMSNTTQKAEELLSTETLPNAIGQQVKAIAQEQKAAQSETKAQLDKVDQRSKLAKTLLGPDYKTLKNMEKQLEQNQLRIQQLTELQNQLVNQGDTTVVQEMIQALTE